jgi:hypothetical protein
MRARAPPPMSRGGPLLVPDEKGGAEEEMRGRESPARFPIFEEDVSPLIYKGEQSPLKSPRFAAVDIPTIPPPEPALLSPKPVRSPSPITEIINPLDRPSSPDPFADPQPSFSLPYQAPPESQSEQDEDMESVALSRTTGREDDEHSMSDWTEAFDTPAGSEAEGSDFDGDESDVMSDAESEASWARVRNNSSERYGTN